MTTPTATPPSGTPEAILAAETSRRSAIRDVFTGYADEHRALLDELLDDPKASPGAASQRLLKALAAQHPGPLAHGWVAASQRGGHGDLMAAATDAICLRAGIPIASPHPGARDLVHTSVLDIARSCLSQAGRSHRLMSPAKTISAAMTTSDFPAILENVLGKGLRAGYESDPQSHVAWVKRTQVPDFKTQSRLLLGSAPPLEVVVEGGEYKFGSMSENKATLAVTKYGKLLRLTWETLVNDDLGAFMSIPQAMGAAARRKEADAVYGIFTAGAGSGQTMQDSQVLFHSSHGNLSAVTGALSVTTLGAARTLLRKQEAIGHGGYLNLVPKFLIVAAEDETLAEQVLASATRHALGASTAVTSDDTTSATKQRTDAATPEWISRLQLVVEPRLNAAYGFYLAAHHSQIDTVELATLEADGGAPVLEEDREFVQDAQTYKVRHVFVAKAIDWKGLVRIPKS